MIGKILGNSAFWIVNKEIAKATSIEAALMLADLTDKEEYFKARGEITECGFFFNTSEAIKENTGLTYHVQKKALKMLIDAGFIETKLKGVPAKLHFKIVENKILNFLKTGIKENQKQDFKEFETNKNKSNNNKVSNNKKIEPATAKKAVEPQTPKEPAVEQKDLFGEKPNPNKKTLFKNSLVSDFKIFEKKLKEAGDQGVDLLYYYNSILDWSNIKNMKRTTTGWVSTATQWMRQDREKNKLKMMQSTGAQIQNDQEAQEYLEM